MAGMKHRQTLRCSFLRVWAFALLSPPSHKSSYIQCRPSPGSRFAGPPGPGPRRLPPTPPNHPAARFIDI